jgi:hypothetical protein
LDDFGKAEGKLYHVGEVHELLMSRADEERSLMTDAETKPLN